MMISASEQLEDVRQMASSGWIGRISAAVSVIGILLLVLGVVCLVFGFVSTNVDGENGHENHFRNEHDRHEGTGPIWVAGIILLSVSGGLLGLSTLACVCLCLYQTNTGANKMTKQKLSPAESWFPPPSPLPPMRELSLSSHV